MSWERKDIALDEGQVAFVEIISSVQSQSTFEVSELEMGEAGVTFAYQRTTGVAPDPVVTTRYVLFVPWSNVRAIHQSWAV